MYKIRKEESNFRSNIEANFSSYYLSQIAFLNLPLFFIEDIVS